MALRPYEHTDKPAGAATDHRRVDGVADQPEFLATAPASLLQRRVALAIIVMSAIGFAAAVPFAKVPLGRVDAFMPGYESALIIIDLVTAVLLLGQFVKLRSLAILALAAGFFFDALIIVPHLLSFPGAFGPAGIVGGGAQTTVWLYTFWHAGFPIFVIAYALLRGADITNAPKATPGLALGAGAFVVVLVAAIVAVTTIGHDALPRLMMNNVYAGTAYFLGMPVWVWNAFWIFGLVGLSLVLLLRGGVRSILDLSLAVVMSAWVFDIALAAVLNGGRFDFGFYFGRVYGLLAASFVLVVILLEMSGLFNRLAETTAKLKGDLARLTHHDALTGLPNRSAFAERLEEAVDMASADGSAFALLHVDLDEFKEINDVFGPAAGDLLLRAVSYRLQAIAGNAFLARMGGDEFSIICPTGKQAPAATALVEELLAATAGAFEIEGQWLHVSLSIGVAAFPDDGADARTLLGNADAALIQAKAAGRGVAHFFDSATDRPVRETHALQNELRSAVALDQLVVHYQPQATIEGEVFGFEALVRWQHPRRGLVPPSDFIALAEQSGIINEIGEWVLRQAAHEAASWQSELQISVNLSPIQLSHERLPNLVHSILLETGLRPDRLELEVTEGALIRDPIRGIAVLRRLRTLGVRISMDDFGTGYSCLSSLQSFPFDKIKIDGGFIAGLGAQSQSRAIVRAVVGLGRTLGIPVIAEGVETEAQRLFLLQEGCFEIQGYLIGRPAPIAEYARWACGERQAARA